MIVFPVNTESTTPNTIPIIAGSIQQRLVLKGGIMLKNLFKDGITMLAEGRALNMLIIAVRVIVTG